jgi:hypothetical protein
MHKTEFGFEKYFVTLPYDLANVLCKLTCGSHRLPIECGSTGSLVLCVCFVDH